MLQNKIYHNYCLEIIKLFLTILLSLSLIAWTVRAVNFLDLIVNSGYSVLTYFEYSLLNIFGIITKFIPLSFLVAITIFILRQIQENEFIILWTSGVKKIQIVNLFLLISIIITVFHLFFSIILTPSALSKSRYLLSNQNLTSILPTFKIQKFTDTFMGLTFIVDDKINNKISNIFLHDESNNLNNIISDKGGNITTTIIAKSGIVENKQLVLFNGNIISTRNNLENETIKFEKIKIDLSNLTNTTIKQPKIQETSTVQLLNCLINRDTTSYACNENFIKETVPVLNRRLVTPFYIPVLSLICSLLLIKSKKIFYNRIFVFSYGFFILIFTEITVRYTGLNNFAATSYLLSPLLLIILIYSILIFNLSTENKTNE